MTQMTHDRELAPACPPAACTSGDRPLTALGMTQMTQRRAGIQAKKEGGILLEGVG